MEPENFYRVRKNTPPVRILDQMDTLHTTSSYSSKMHLNIILPRRSTKFCGVYIPLHLFVCKVHDPILSFTSHAESYPVDSIAISVPFDK
jgi:hypothetical protein